LEQEFPGFDYLDGLVSIDVMSASVDLLCMESAFSSLLSSLEPFQQQDIFPNNAIHPFSTATPATCALIQDLINTTDQLSHSLAVCDSAATCSNPKLISLLRQHSSIEHTTCSVSRILYLRESEADLKSPP
jgi:hypothetical protein